MRPKVMSLAIITALVVSVAALAALSFGYPAQAASGQSWAILVGIDDYQSINDCPYADDDAFDLYGFLEPIWGADHLKLLTNSQATRAAINSAILDWLDPLEDSDDLVLFFFSGHGGQTSDKSPYDESDGLDEVICPYDSLTYSRANDIYDDDLDGWLDSLESEKAAVILDTCFSGGFKGASKGRETEGAASVSRTATYLGDSFSKDLSQSGRVVLCASAESQSSYLWTTFQNGVFSHFLLQGLAALESVDDDSDGLISAEELFSYVEPKTVDYVSRIIGESQNPQLSDGYAGELPLFCTASVDFSSNPNVGSVSIDGLAYAPPDVPVSKDFVLGANVTVIAESTAGTCETLDIQSPHPYPNYYLNTWTVNRPGAARIRVHFEYVDVEVSYDDTFIKDGDGATCESIDGNFQNRWSNWVAGDTLQLVLDSDGSIVGDGFAIDAVEWQSEGTRCFFTSWSDESTCASRTITVNGAATYTANYTLQHLLVVDSPWGEPQGEGWYDQGSTAEFSVSPVVDHGDGSRHVFISWSGDSTANISSSTVLMESPRSVTAGWKLQYRLTVQSAWGNPQGDAWYDEGSTAEFSVSPVVDHGDGSRHVFISWSGDSTASTASSSVTMDRPKLVTADWKTQYYLSLSTNPPGVCSIRGTGWYDSRVTASIGTAPTNIVVGDDTVYRFAGWKVDGNTVDRKPVSVMMDKPHSLFADYTVEYLLTVESEYGDPSGSGWYENGSTAIISVKSPVGMVVRQVFTGWTEDTAGVTPTTSVFMDGPRSVVANWRTDYSQLFIIVGGVAGVCAIVAFAFVFRRRRSSTG